MQCYPNDMLSRVKNLLFGDDAAANLAEEANAGGPDVVAALLLQAALADGHFSDDERTAVATILERDHDARPEDVADLMDEAEVRVRESVQMFGLTSAINQSMDIDAKVALMESLWEVILTDGVIDAHEGNLMRRLAGLLHVPDRSSAEARQRAASRTEKSD